MNRRQFICTAVAAAAMPLPVPLAIKAAPAASPLLPAWTVGTPGEWDWQVVRAKTNEDAVTAWAEESGYYKGEDCSDGPDCECDFCWQTAGVDADRQERWDNIDVTAGDEHWFKAGMGSNCKRCGYETFQEEGGRFVAGAVVRGDCMTFGAVICGDCMTLADWEIVDPERAAELRDEI